MSCNDRLEGILNNALGRAVLLELAGIDWYTYLGIPVNTGFRQHTLNLASYEVRSLTHQIAAAAHALPSISDTQILQDISNTLENIAYGPSSQWLRRSQATAQMIDLLLPLGQALLEHDCSTWWWLPIDYSHQIWLGATTDAPPRKGLIEPGVAKESETFSTDINDRYAGPHDVNSDRYWWTEPDHSLITTRALTGSPCVRSVCRDGHRALAEKSEEIPLKIHLDEGARVYEVSGIDDWLTLISNHPNITARRPGWFNIAVDEFTYQALGIDTNHGKTSVSPYWLAIGEHWDAVHIPFGVYLSHAYTPLEIDGRLHMLCGWDPDATAWLNKLSWYRF